MKRYPTPQTVAILSPASPSFWRRRRMWLSTARSKPSKSPPQIRSIRNSRLKARPGLATNRNRSSNSFGVSASSTPSTDPQWLDQVIVRTHLQTEHAIDFLGTCREHDDRHQVVLAELTADG